MTDFSELKAKWLSNPSVKAEYDALNPEFKLAHALLEKSRKTPPKMALTT